MSTDYWAYTIIGLRLTYDDLIEKETGEYIDEYYPNEDEDDDNGILILCDKNDVTYGVKKLGEYYYVIADMTSIWFMGSASADKSECSLDELCEKRDKMKDDLSSIGLWDSSKFGIYTISDCSH